jgi:hypothetical protein
MSRFRPLEILLPIGVFVLGLGTGSWLTVDRRGVNSAASIDARLAPPGRATPTTAPEPKRSFATQEEMLTAVMSAVSENDELARAHRLHEALGGLDRGELGELFQRVVKVDDRDRREAALYAILARWAAIDPDGVMAAVRPYIERLRGMGNSAWRAVESGVVRAWAEAMPDAALAEASRPSNGPWVLEMARIAVETLAGGEPARQFDVLMRVPEGRLRNDLCESALRALAEKDFTAAEARLDLITDPWKRDSVHGDLLGQLARHDPSAALARLVELGPGIPANLHGTKMVSSVMESAGKDNSTAALAAVDRLPEELRSSALDSALVGWGRTDPIAAMDWAASQGMDVAQIKSSVNFSTNGFASWTTLLLSAYYADYGKTLDWVRAQPASPARDDMLQSAIWSGNLEQKMTIYAALTSQAQAEQAGRMVGDMQNDDPKRVAAWVNDLPAGAARAQAVETLAEAQATKTPDRIDSLADDWSAGPDRNAALEGIADNLMSKDPERALTFALRINDPNSRESVLDSIFFSWDSRNQSAARAWLSGASGFSPEHQRVLLRQRDDRVNRTR